MKMQFFSGGNRRTFLIFAVVFILLFWDLGENGLLNPDEGRYSEIPREMIESGDYITPRLNYVKYFEKPVLHYWMTALSFMMWGENEAGSRFVPTLLACATVVCVWLLARKMYDRDTADWSVLVLGTSLLFYGIAQINLTDMPLVFFMTLSFASAWAAIQGERVHRGAVCVFYAAIALSLLTKGLIGIVLPGCVLLTFILCTRRFRLIVDLISLPGILLFTAIALPWFWAVCTRNPDFFYFFFVQEHFLRYATKLHGRYQPVWFFIPILVAGFIPWIGFMPGALRDAWKGVVSAVGQSWCRGKSRFSDMISGDSFADLYLVLWTTVILFFFSVSNSKLIPYIVPAMPPLAILMGRAIVLRTRAGNRHPGLRFVLRTQSVLLGLLGSAFLISPFVLRSAKFDMRFMYFVGAGYALGLFAFIALSWKYREPAHSNRLFRALCGVSFFLAGVSMEVPDIVIGNHSSFEVAKEVNRILRPDDIVANYGTYLHGLTFYTKRRTLLVEFDGELKFGLNAEREQNAFWFPDKKAFLSVWEGQRRVLLVVEAGELKKLPDYVEKKHYIPAKTRHFFVLSNRPE